MTTIDNINLYADGNSKQHAASIEGMMMMASNPSMDFQLFDHHLNDYSQTNTTTTQMKQPQSTSTSPEITLFSNPQSSTVSSTPATKSKKRLRETPVSDSPESASGEDGEHKRKRNTEAARRYRQRKVDRVSDLEEALTAMTKERDEMRLSLARAQAEADILRGMVKHN